MNSKNTLSKNNSDWFGREGAFEYLKQDADNQLRIKKVMGLLSSDGLSTGKLLDIGCGGGEVSCLIKKLGYQVIGLELNPKLVKKAKEKGIIVKQGDAAEKLPFKSGFFNLVYAGEVIEHLFDTELFLTEINRVLKKGGVLVLTTPNLVHLPDRIKFLKGKTPAQVNPIHHFLKYHIRPFTYPQLKHCLESFGFEVEKFVSTMVVFKRDGEEVASASKLLAKLFPQLGSFLIVKAVKISG